VKTYSARFGIIPLSQKAEKLKNLEDVVICEVEAGSFKGFLVRGKGRHGQAARAQLIDVEKELDIRFYFYGPGAANDSIVGPILHSLKAL
jgi:hypothetical protein